jgi:hypothetical protein
MPNMETSDVKIIRELAKEYMEAAMDPSNLERIKLWKRLNSLQDTRPMVTMDQLPWNELNGDGELTVRCEERILRSVENDLRMQLYKFRHFRADHVLHPWVDIPKTIRNWGFGLVAKEEMLMTDPTSAVKSHKYFDQLESEEAVEAMTFQKVGVDPERDNARLARLNDVLAGIMPGRLSGMVMHCGVWDYITFIRNANAVILDLADRPEHSMRIVKKFVDIAMNLADQAEELGLFDAGAPLIHCTGAYTDELPGTEFTGEKAMSKDVWGFGLAQIFSTVSPAMHDEYEIGPVAPLLDRFGLMYYGCCDPLDRKIDIVRKLKTVRKISVSPWADKERSAAHMEGDYVFSLKPNPAFLAFDAFEAVEVEKELREAVEACKRHHTTCEFILKDVSTVRYQPERLTEWERIAMKVANEW